MLVKKIIFLFAISLTTAISWNCNLLKKVGDINLFSIEDDKALGLQVSKQIESDPKQFPVLPEKGNEEAYKYIRGLTTQLLRSGKVAHANEFDWKVNIIKDDKTLNAFAVPGGHLYVYTGLIQYLDSEDQLAGVMGHEIAHAAERHSTQQMTKLYGLDALRQIATGNKDPGMLEQLAVGLASLKFSRSHEAEADEQSVIYLCSSSLNAAGAAGFFEKMKGKGGSPPEFLSTHPDPGNRIKDIRAKAKSLGCRGSKTNKTEYDKIKKLLK
ncbi:MAG: M48 family metalloprotease [Saprospiraceae bacterium]|nr:M48 family metalloprotease [Saprospiraceae bacterium]